MELGLIGLGKMGYHLGLNILDHGHTLTAYDRNEEAVGKLAEAGARPAGSLQQLVANLSAPRTVWVMVPSGEATDEVIDRLADIMSKGDTIIDGGNSNYEHSLARSEALNSHGIHFVDAGTSGGVDGARYGTCIMAGGPDKAMARLKPLFEDLSVENGFLHTGPAGSGHFLKMIHNGIEYGMMQAIAEGFDILEKSPFDYDYKDVAGVWNNGSVIRSWLMELTENAFSKDEKLDKIQGIMHSSGEGKWTVETALNLQASAPVIALSLMMRYRSLETDTFSGKVVAALRNEFGGHDVVKKTE